MKLKLPLSALALLRFVLTFTGEKEMNSKGEEVDAPRRLSGEESSQRRHFIKAIIPLQEEVTEKVNLLVKEHNAKVGVKREKLKEINQKSDSEKESDYEIRINNLLNIDVELNESLKSINKEADKFNREEHEIDVMGKTKEVVKKYFGEYGEKIGFGAVDDEWVEAIEDVLK